WAVVHLAHEVDDPDEGSVQGGHLKLELALHTERLADFRSFLRKEFLEEVLSLGVEIIPRLAFLVAQLNLLQVLPVAPEVLHGVLAGTKQVGDGHVDERPEHESGAVNSGPQLLDII